MTVPLRIASPRLLVALVALIGLVALDAGVSPAQETESRPPQEAENAPPTGDPAAGESEASKSQDASSQDADSATLDTDAETENGPAILPGTGSVPDTGALLGPGDLDGGEKSGDEKRELPPEYYEELESRKEAFQKKRVELHEAMAEQRIIHIQYLNHEKRTKADREAYYAKRLEVRRLLDDVYIAAINVLRVGFEKEEATYVVTLLQNRSGYSYYDYTTLEGAARMMNGGSQLLFVFQMAARSAVAVGDFETAKKVFDVIEDEKKAEIDKTLAYNLPQYKASFEREAEIRAREAEEDRLPRVKFETTQGDVIVELFIDQAPTAVSHFIQLVEKGYYDRNDFMQVIDDLFALCGDPSGTGSGNSGKFLVDEHTREDARDAFRGSLVMAKLPIGDTGKFVPNSGSSQFAILYLPILSVSAEQTVFGRVIEGMENVSFLRRVDPHKKKEKNEIQLPPDRLLRATVIRRPETLPEPVYYDLRQQPAR